ncbi:ubiquitin-like domain-containing protein [Paenibacillus sp. y28]|uniref:ubiquitin-like domain-containing protein n=1 Tax=Paenibacillus sp. y28 TaxID=3129110 RepID=UPI00301907FC
MGIIPDKETHGKRSSSMSFALRWKRENKRLIASVALFSFALTFMFLMLLYGTATKSVSVVVDGQEKQVKTKQYALKRLLDEQAISVGQYDRLSMPLDTVLKNGDRIVIEKAAPIRLTADGKTETLYTTGKTVGSALQELNISLGELDKVTPEADSAITPDGEVKVVRVTKQQEETTEPIPFEVVKKNDPNLLKGKEQTVQEGKEGALTKIVEKTFEDGTLVSEAIVDENVQTESVSKIVAIGSKNPVVALSASSPSVDEVTKSGVTFGYKQILNNVTVTAYSAGVASTGKGPDHPGYGMTASGSRAMEGRTIAVDPKVVPMGWWVYIEGIGFRRAEDTGSAVKGNTIDIYFENESYAQRFGLKRGYKVYIIGKDKPAVN